MSGGPRVACDLCDWSLRAIGGPRHGRNRLLVAALKALLRHLADEHPEAVR